MIKIYIILAGVVVGVFFAYGQIKYREGYSGAQADYNKKIIELMSENQKEKNKIQNKVKELQNAQTDCPVIDASRSKLLNE